MSILQRIIILVFNIINQTLYLVRSFQPAKIKLKILSVYILISVKWFTICKIRNITSETILGMDVSFFDYCSFRFLFKEIFIRNEYYFKSSNKKPIIFDCGANIGISILYFKLLYPNSIIYAFEPDPKTFKLLEKNIRQNNFKNVHLYNVALLDKEGKVDFYIDSGNPGKPAMSILKQRLFKNKIIVEGHELSKYIGKKNIDFLKMDIEGAETIVFKEIDKSKKIQQIKEYVIEYHHGIKDSKAKLSSFLQLLEKNDYGYRIDTGSLLIYQRDIFQDILIYGYKNLK